MDPRDGRMPGRRVRRRASDGRGVAVGHDRELDAGIDGLVDRVGRDRIEDDDPALDLGGTQGQRLVERRDAQGIDDGLQRTGDRDEAVSIGIRLDDRRDTHAGADDATDDPDVLADRLEIDLDPGVSAPRHDARAAVSVARASGSSSRRSLASIPASPMRAVSAWPASPWR